MSAECFSWCRTVLRRWDAKKLKQSRKLPEKQQAPVPPTTSIEKQDPWSNNAADVELIISRISEAMPATEILVKKIDTLYHSMLTLADKVAAKNQEGYEEGFVKPMKRIESTIEDIVSSLDKTNKELTEIPEENRCLMALYAAANTSPVESCLDRLSTVLEKFELSVEQSALMNRISVLQFEQVVAKFPVVCRDLDNVHQFVVETLGLTALHRSETTVRHEMPLKPEVFHGRDGLVDEIAQLLTNEDTSRVCILGPGGMGKTSISLAVVELPLIRERFPSGNRVWVPCIEVTSTTLLLKTLYVQLQVPRNKEVTLENIISELDSSIQPRLLLFDNFDTPWNAPGGTQKQVEDILRTLADLNHVAILVTMRGSYPPCHAALKWQSKEIQPTDEASCLRIYHDINPDSENDPDVAGLLAALGHMPLAVTLMAKLGIEGQSTAKQLLDAWTNAGPDILPDYPECNLNRSISLSVNSDLVKQDPDALLLLQTLSLLPAGTTIENLRWWAPKVKMHICARVTLFDASLLFVKKLRDPNSPVLFVLPVVQSFMQQRDRVTEEIRKQMKSSCCQYVLDHACRYDDPTFSVKSKALALEEINIRSILFGSPAAQQTDTSTIEALIAFSWHLCDTKPNSEIANYVVTVAKASGITKYIASAVWCLGKTYQQLGNHSLSYDHLQDAYQLFNTLPPGEVEAQRSAGQCGIDLVDSACSALVQVREEVVSLARDVEAKCATLSDELVHGRSLVFLWAALDRARQQQEASVHLGRARIMLEALKDTPNLAAVYQVIARVHYREGRFPEALDAIEEAWRHAESIDNPFIQGSISLEFGMILFSADRVTEAWTYIETAQMKSAYTGNWLTAARASEYMGYGYLHQGDYSNAFSAYEVAAENYIVDPITEPVERRCRHNMAGIQQKQRNPDAVIGFHRHSLDVDTSLFYPPRDIPISSF